jgi:predicted ATPase
MLALELPRDPVELAQRRGLRVGPSSRFSANGMGDLQFFSEVGGLVFGRGWREGPGGGRKDVLIVLPASEQPTPAILDRLTHEHSLKDALDSTWAVRPLELVRDRGRIMLVLEDPGGELLSVLPGTPMEVGRFLRIAVGVAAALGKVHQRGLIHKDIKPANILVNSASGEVRLTGFGIASRLPRERQPPDPPEIIAGTLAYMAPEQTGRMNRSIDSRSDLYSFGVTLYEMLTGGLPFTASDPMEWVHCHIARQADAPGERTSGIPDALSSIVMKLLAKTAGERYQTAAGVEADLRRCLSEWQSHGRVDPFPPGAHDASDQLLIAEELYGRETEIATLLAAFDRVVAQGTPELVLVSGYSGVGKSAVVNELHKVLVPPRGLFAAGKFDQYKRDIPFATLAQAFQTLIRQILVKSEAAVEQWRRALATALGPHGQLIVNLVPELEFIIGKQPAVPDLPPQEAQNRFQLAFRRFIGAFARHEHPLALFLDDLQWMDAATIELIEHLVTHAEVRHLLLVGAYRDNEVASAHPLLQMLEAIRKADGNVREIVLAPLGLDDVGRLTAGALHCSVERARPLTELIHEKTDGNPFFAIQFLTELADEGLLSFDAGARGWQWDIDRIRAKGYTDNLADLMAGKLVGLPGTTLETIKQLACLGNSAEAATMGMVFEVSEQEIHAALWPVVSAGLVLRLDGAYSFLHDRVQEAAYALIPAGERPAVHLRIGRRLASATPAIEFEENIFEIVNQFNHGADLIDPLEEREQLAEFNLVAGRRARSSAAYASALMYSTAGTALLSEDSWERCYGLTFALSLQQAECEYVIGDLGSAEKRLAMLSGQARGLADSAAVTCLRVDLFTNLDRADRAVEIGLKYLEQVGIEWPLHPTDDAVGQEYQRIWQLLGARSVEGLIHLPPMTDRDRRATLDVLAAVHAPANFIDGNLLALVIGRMANLSFEHGNGDAPCFA